MGNYSMPGYFQNMPVIGKALRKVDANNEAVLKQIEAELKEFTEKSLANGTSDEKMNAKGQLTAMQRIALLVDPGTWCPLNSIYNPCDNKTGTDTIIKGLGRINGKWAVIIASDNKKHAGTWVPGQADDLLRGSDTAKRLRIPLVYVLNCAGVELDKQEQVYPNRRGGGTPFYRNSELNQLGVPVIVGIYGTNPAGGGYHSISPTILIAHQKANMAVGGAGIVGGMNPKGYVDQEGAEALIKGTEGLRADPPGSVAIHYNTTGFFREVYQAEEGVIAGIKKYMDMLPAYDVNFFRVDDPKAPAKDANELYSIVQQNTKRPYDMYDVIARLVDASEVMEFKKVYGLLKFTRQDYSNVLRDPSHRYHETAMALLEPALEDEAEEILSMAKEVILRANNEVDIVAVYGGGSILMRPALEDRLRAFCNRAGIRVLYIDEEYAVPLEAMGLHEFVESDLFALLRSRAES